MKPTKTLMATHANLPKNVVRRIDSLDLHASATARMLGDDPTVILKADVPTRGRQALIIGWRSPSACGSSVRCVFGSLVDESCDVEAPREFIVFAAEIEGRKKLAVMPSVDGRPVSERRDGDSEPMVPAFIFDRADYVTPTIDPLTGERTWRVVPSLHVVGARGVS